MFRASILNNNILLRKRQLEVPLLLLFLLTIHILIFFILNILIREGQLEHPDSRLYDATALALVNDWNVGNFHIINYPEYSNIVAAIYYVSTANPIIGSFTNIVIHILTALIAYKTIRNLQPSKYIPSKAPLLVLLVIGLEPYALYLSTQLLKDAIIMLGTALVVLSLTSSKLRVKVLLSLIGMILIAVLRTEYAQALIIALILYSFLQLHIKTGTIRNFVQEVFPLLLAILPLIAFNYVRNEVYLEPLSSHKLASYREAEKLKVLARTNWAPGIPHIEFYENRSPVTNNDRCKTPNVFATNLTYCSKEVAQNLTQGLFFPYPWKANTLIELSFAIYMLGWYVLLALGVLSYIVKPRPLFTSTLLMLTLSLLLPLSLYVVKQSGFVRWRTPLFYMAEIAILLSIVKLLHYKYAKRAMDIAFSLSLLIITLPLSISIVITNLVLRVPIIFKQTRAGLDEKQITIYKFTTLIKAKEEKILPEGLAFSATGMKYTPIGKLLRSLALDEMPQLINILRGDISLVGPRALDWELHTHCRETIPNWTTRTRVLPGVIGLAQLNTDRLDNNRRLRYDIQYVNNPGLILDFTLIIQGLLNSIRMKWH